MVIGCPEKGYSIGDDGVIENSVGDAKCGPIPTFVGNDIDSFGGRYSEACRKKAIQGIILSLSLKAKFLLTEG